MYGRYPGMLHQDGVLHSLDIVLLEHFTLTDIGGQFYVSQWLLMGRSISTESLVIGALEAAFWETDQVIGEEKKVYNMTGGCTVLVALFILGQPYST